MNKTGTLLLLFFLLVITPAFSQFQKGMRVPGLTVGSAFFNSGSVEYTSPPPTDGYKSNTNSLGFDLLPSLGWFISDRTVIGGRVLLGYRYDKYLDESNNVSFRKKEERNFSAGVGVFLRNYFNTTGRFIPFTQVNIDGGIGNTTTEGYNYTQTYREAFNGKSSGDFFARAGLMVGVTRMIGKHTGIDLSAGYMYSYDKDEFRIDSERDIDFDGTIDETGISSLTSKSRNHGFTLSAGIQVFLPKREKR